MVKGSLLESLQGVEGSRRIECLDECALSP